jgi:ATP-dependent Clp protease protease subunit
MTKYYWCNEKPKKKAAEETPEEPPPSIIFMGEPNGGPPDSCVEVLDNTIMFYGEVNEKNAKSLNKALRTLDKELQIFKLKYGCESPPLRLFINSYGGSVFAGFSIMDTIKNCKTPVHSYVDGSAASAATLISVVAKKRFIFPNSFMLVHQLSSTMWGNYEAMKDEMENLDLIMDRIKKIYKEHTNMGVRQITNILKKDKWFEAELCLELGLVDEIVESE